MHTLCGIEIPKLQNFYCYVTNILLGLLWQGRYILVRLIEALLKDLRTFLSFRNNSSTLKFARPLMEYGNFSIGWRTSCKAYHIMKRELIRTQLKSSIVANKSWKIIELMLSTQYNLTKFFKPFSKVRVIRAVTFSLPFCLSKP
jgi:hypothetical protein